MSDHLADDVDRAPVRRRGSAWREWPHRALADGRLLAVEPLLMGAGRLHIVADEASTASVSIYDFTDLSDALVQLHRWNGRGEPKGWYRHRPSNRRRPDGDPKRQYVAP